MHNGFSRLLVLLAIFCSAFLAVIVVRKVNQGDSLWDILRGRASIEDVENRYTLQKDPSLKLRQVRTLDAINRESATLVDAVKPSVVSIDTTGVQHERKRDVWGRTWVQQRSVQGQGSGVIVSKEGHILTNYHVIKGNPSISVTLHGGHMQSAKIIGTDPTVDIAVLKLEGPGPYKPLKFGDSDQAHVGNIVFAFGSPFGLGESVTDGLISAKKRSFIDTQVDLIQTSAAINPGNSGGPLVNIQGEIIGINSRIYSSDQKNPGFQGISFAIPSNAALKTMQDILARGRPIRGFLGMALEIPSPKTRNKLLYNEAGGILVVGLAPNAPALNAGLKINDIIISYDGTPVSDTRELIAKIQRSKVDSDVTLKIWRDKKVQTITARVANADDFSQETLDEQRQRTLQNIDLKKVLSAIGLKVRNPSAKEVSRGVQGVIIDRVLPSSQLKGKLIAGDLIRAINGRPVWNDRDFINRLAASVATQNTELYLQRGSNSVHLTLSPLK